MIKRPFALCSFALGLVLAAAALLTPTNPVSLAQDKNRTAPANGQGEDDVPYLGESEFVNAIDALIAGKWKEKKLTPSAAADDYEWLRRVYLDAVGRVPSAEEVQAFVSNKAKTRREDVIDRLLDSDDHADYWASLWRAALVSTGGATGRRGVQQLENWLSGAFRANRSYDEMARELVTATGEVVVNDGEVSSPAGYLISFDNEVNNVAGNVSRAFLGVEIQCAQCHDHPYETWKQEDFLGFAAIFHATRVSRNPGGGNAAFVVADNPVRRLSERRMRRLGEAAKDKPKLKERLELAAKTPTLLGGKEIEGKDGGELRSKLADWMTSKQNPWFARAAVNRVWALLLKRGIVEPVDDFNSVNTPSNSELLDLLAAQFAAGGFDLRRLTRVIMRTQAYGLSSRLAPKGANKDDNLWYSRAYVAQLSGEQLFNSVMTATKIEQAADKAKRRDIAKLKRLVLRQFTFAFEDDEGKERESFTGTIPQALMMMNSEFVARAVAVNPGSTLDEILKKHSKPQDRVDALYLAALGRPPSLDERNRMTRFLTGEKGTVAAYEDAFWALLNSAEFLNNH